MTITTIIRPVFTLVRMLAFSIILLSPTICPLAPAQDEGRTMARIFWQEQGEQCIRWGDLKKGKAWSLMVTKLEDFPELDVDQQSLVQMASDGEHLVVGVRDQEDGQFQSGWVAISSGLARESHGDHDHWRFKTEPTIMKIVLDDQQGNPAHAYHYDGRFFLANDKKNGVTIIDPQGLKTKSNESGIEFLECGGGHITIAAIGNKVCYGTWFDPAGDNDGRVDVVGLGSNQGQSYSFHLPAGGLHGATANSNKVFLAPTDGIYWLEADLKLRSNAQNIEAEHLSLGEDNEGNPRRTGAFATHRNWVLCTTGRGETPPELCIVDASKPKLSVQRMSLPTEEGTSVTTPVCVRTRTGIDYALLFEESSSGEQSERLHVIELDPNRDGNAADARVKASLGVGPSLIQGHNGHHQLTSFAGGRYAAITNPGDGTLWILSTRSWEVEAKLSVGGTPTRIAAFFER